MDHSSFMPHGVCFLWSPDLLWLHVIADAVIALAYLTIPPTLVYLVVRARRELESLGGQNVALKGMPYSWMFYAFGTFIVACGITHIFGVITMWYPIYWVSGSVKVVTAFASVATAMALPPLIPRIIHTLKEARLAEIRAEQVVEAERLADAKSEFLAVMSHEIRTPLNAVLGYSELIQQDYAGPTTPQQQLYLSRITGSVEHLRHIIDHVLDYTRLEAGVVQPQIVPVRIKNIVTEAVNMLRPAAFTKGLTMDIVALPDIVAQGDAVYIKQVILNLLSNAVKFTSTGGVKISVTEDYGQIYIDVSDTGIGLSEREVKSVFDPFWQAERGVTRQVTGTGLGLTVAQRLAQGMGGNLEVLKSKKDKGTIFRFTLRGV